MLRAILAKLLRPKAGQEPELAFLDTLSAERSTELDVYDVFSVSTVAPKSYIDRSGRPVIRNLQRALEQPGKIVGLYGPSKSGKTTFVRKVLAGRKAGFVIISGQQVHSVEDYWRQVSESLKLALETAVAVERGETRQQAGEASARSEFSMKVVGASAEAKFAKLSEKMLLRRTEAEPISSIRTRCLEFLGSTKTAVVLDDFHEIKNPAIREAILRDIKPAAGAETGKFIFVSIPKDAFIFKSADEQIRNRFAFYELPLWSDQELEQIAQKGFDLLGIEYGAKQILYIGRSSFGNPLNVQQICINVCTNLKDHVRGSQDKRRLPVNAVTTALEDFAVEHQDYLSIIDEAEKRGTALDREKKYKYEGVDLNIYQMIFAAISIMGSGGGGGGENGLLIKSITKRIADQTGTMISRERMERVVAALADVEFNVQFPNQGPSASGTQKPFVYSAEEKKIFVTNPIFRMFLLWGYRPSIGLENPVRNMLVASEN